MEYSINEIPRPVRRRLEKLSGIMRMEITESAPMRYYSSMQVKM